ncbi:MAG: hypothetical protein LC792_24105 [Actinobacteria bacterium]|nr:hypothetical protein [Actinomycetota bacterium]
MAWTASPNPTTANDGAQVYSNDEIVAAKAFMVDGVMSWDVAIRPVNGGPPSTCHEDLEKLNNRYPQEVYINCPWDTTRVTNHTLAAPTKGSDADDPRFSRTWQSQDLGPSTNGKYTIEITAKNANNPCLALCAQYEIQDHPLYQSGSNPARWREVWVVNDVSLPGGVTSSYDQASSRISVSWSPVPEPDVSYVVQEKVGDGKWGGGGTVPGNATRYDRVVDQPGTYQYRVQAVRTAPTSNSGNGASATKKSDYAVAAPVEIAQIAPPTTAGANNANGTPDGGDPGVFLPGDTPTTAGAPGSTRTTRPKGTAAAGRSGPLFTGAKPAGASNKPAGAGATAAGEAEGEGPDEGFAPTLPYQGPQDGFTEEDGLGDEGGPQALGGGVVPKPHDTRELMVFMAAALVLFLFAMQVTIFLRRSKPATAASSSESDFDDWLGF